MKKNNIQNYGEALTKINKCIEQEDQFMMNYKKEILKSSLHMFLKMQSNLFIYFFFGQIMDRRWEVSEEHYIQNLKQNPLFLKRQGSQQIEKPATESAQESQKTRMRYRTTSMPKLEDNSKPNSPTKKPNIEPPQKIESIIKVLILSQRISLSSTIFHTHQRKQSSLIRKNFITKIIQSCTEKQQ